ncbi:HAD-like protein [Fistulina hepatica ATCC 64428]|uniref:HAD-like protein n=1 Tax=Fistulina hepatica ATCC 64428 TaxID=1128425 RepID=A0A0D7AL77_9AGAR|nr:HAD-like protein [Fistulina hepatica ATCC 64428]
MSSQPQTFYADAVLFDMDGTLTDSIRAVEAAWGKVARDIGQDPEFVIAATHGKRAVDNLAQFKPYIKVHEMDAEVQAFEESILFFADAYNVHGPGSRPTSRSNSLFNSPLDSPLSSAAATPALTASNSRSSSFVGSRKSSVYSNGGSRRPSFGTHLLGRLSMTTAAPAQPEPTIVEPEEIQDDVFVEDVISPDGILTDLEKERMSKLEFQAWQIEAACVDRSVRILPGVKKMISSIPAGRYAVATSGAKTYAYGCMTRVGITPPPVTITADDKRLKAGKPAPDPFLLAAKELGYDPKRCVVFEDSPSGIRAGVASGATVIAVCTSHERSKIENCGAHYIVDNMEHLSCEVEGDRLKFTVCA